MKTFSNMFRIVLALVAVSLEGGAATADTSKLSPPVIVMTGTSKPLAPIGAPILPSVGVSATPALAAAPSLKMQILVLGDDVNDFSYQSITTYLTQIGVPYVGIPVDTLTPDSSGNRLSSLAFVDTATGHGLYQGLIYTDSTFGVCNPTCGSLLSTADWTTLSNYQTQFNVRVVTYYTYPDPKWGLSIVGSGASYTAANPLSVKLTPAGASLFPYINSANAIPVAGSGTGGIYAYQATATAAAGETTTPILTAGSNVVGVTHINAAGQQSMSFTFDNYPSLLHSLAFSYGVINWVTNGVFLGSRQIYLNPQVDDILFGDRLYAPTLPQCPNDPSCPVIIGTATDINSLANWQNTKHSDPQVPYLRSSYAFVGIGSTPGFAPVPDTVPAAMTAHAADFGWVTHTWTHGDLDCYSHTTAGACVPATLSQSLFEIEQNAVFAQGLGLPADTTGLVTPFNGGLDNAAFFQAAAEEGVTSVISPNNPPSPGTGAPGLVPSVLLVPRRVTNLFYDVDSPSTGVYGSLPDEYNANYGPGGTTPTFGTNQTYSQIIDNESTMLLQTRMLFYEVYPLGFHMSNSIDYGGGDSLLSDLLDATIVKFKNLYTLPIYTLKDMRDIAPLLTNRASYNASGVTGVYTPGVGVVLTTPKAGVIPVTGACAQAFCPVYGGQMQDSIPMAANSSVTLSLTAGTGVGLSTVSVNPATVNALSPSQGLVTLNGVASSSVVVSLSSNNAAAVVPANVTVSAGNLGAAFTVTTRAVTTATTVIISATYNSVTRTFPLVVAPAAALSGFSLSPASVPAGSSSTATVSLTGPAPAGGAVISIVSNNLAANVPASVTIGAGTSSATFSVTTLAVGATTTGNILAIYNGATDTASFTVTPGIALALSGVTLSPTAVIGGSVSIGTVTLNGLAPAGSIQVTLSSDNAVAVPQGPVFINAGASAATFTVSTTAVTAIKNATIGATYNGVTQNAVLTVAPVFELTGVSLNPASVLGGSTSGGTVTLSGPAPAAGTVVTLSSNNAAAVVPASTTVTSGNFTAVFPVTTTSVAASANATITATYNGVAATAVLTVTPALGLSALSLNPSSVTGGTSSTGTVTLTGSAPAGGIVVSLSSSSTSAVVPASVTVGAGSVTATFTATTSAVTASTTATISAVYNGATRTSSLTITPPAVALSGVSLSPASVTGGTSSTGTVTLTGNAPAGGIVVSLSDNSASAVTPASVTVGAGSSTATFTVTTSAVTASTTATISAVYNGVTLTSPLTITPPAVALSGMSLNPASVTGGTSSTGTVTLTGNAPAGGIVVSLSDNSASAVTPASVTVGAGSSTATFTVTTSAVTASTTATISAVYNGVTLTSPLTITPPAVAISGISFNPASVTGGTSSTGTVTLTGPAPAGGIVVSLSDNSASAVTPASVTVGAGSSTATFTVTTAAVTASTTATISAVYNGTTRTSTLTITPPAVALSGISFNPASVTGGTSSTGTVTLTGNAPAGGIVVSLSDNSASAVTPASVTVGAGSSTATFTVTTSAVTASTTATISAVYNGATRTSTLTITPPAVALSGVSLNPASVTGGTSSTGTVTLTGPAPAGGIVVSLSDNSASAVTPASVTVGAGSSTATFTVTTSAVTASTTATISAVYNGATRTSTLTITPPAVALSGVSLNPASVTGGTSSTGTVTLTGPAPAGGIVVSLSDNSASAVTPASVTVGAGSSTAAFTVTTSVVTASTTATISAVYNGTTRTSTLTITPPAVALSGISFNPASVTGGTSSTGTVTLTGPAPAGGILIVILSSNSASAVVPASVTVAAGSVTATFAATTSAVAASTTATITAVYSGVSKTAQLTVKPPVLLALSLNPSTVKAGNSFLGTVTLNGPAPAGGISISLSVDIPFFSYVTSSSITIPAGDSTASLSVPTWPFPFTFNVNISASYGGVTQNAVLTVEGSY